MFCFRINSCEQGTNPYRNCHSASRNDNESMVLPVYFVDNIMFGKYNNNIDLDEEKNENRIFGTSRKPLWIVDDWSRCNNHEYIGRVANVICSTT